MAKNEKEKKPISRLTKIKKLLPTSSASNLPKPPPDLPPSCLKNPARFAQKPKRNVDFYTKKKTKRIPNVASMSDDVLEALWWSPDDYDDIMRSFEYTVFMMEAGEGKTVDDNIEHCTRGLELRTEAGKWARFEHKRDCYNAVLDEQDRQWNAGEEDNPQLIATACREVTAKTQRIACRKGLKDATEIEDFLRDTRKQWMALQKSKGDSKSTANVPISPLQQQRKNGLKAPTRTISSSSGGAEGSVKSSPRMPQRVSSSKSDRRPSHGSVSFEEKMPMVAADAKNLELSDHSSTMNDSTGAPRAPQRTASSSTPGSCNNDSNTYTSTNKSRPSDDLRPPVQCPSHTSTGSIGCNGSDSTKPRELPGRGSSGKPASKANNKMPRRTLSNKDDSDGNMNSSSKLKLPRQTISEKGDEPGYDSNNNSDNSNSNSNNDSNMDGSKRKLPRALPKRSSTISGTTGSAVVSVNSTGERPKRATSMSSLDHLPRPPPSGKLDPSTFAKFSTNSTSGPHSANSNNSSSPKTVKRATSKLNPNALAKFGG